MLEQLASTLAINSDGRLCTAVGRQDEQNLRCCRFYRRSGPQEFAARVDHRSNDHHV